MPSDRGASYDPSYGVRPGYQVLAKNLSSGIRQKKMAFLNGPPASFPLIEQYGTVAVPVTVPTLPTAVVDNLEGITLPDVYGNQYVELYQTTAQTLMPSRHATKGLLISGDLVDNEAVEFVFGGNHASNPLGCLIGTDPGIHIEATFELADVSGTDQFGIFLRKQEAYAVPVSFLTGGDPIYTDIALFGFAATAATPSIVRSSTDIGNAGTAVVSSTGFSVPDGGIVKLGMRVVGRRIQYFINGQALSDRIAFNGVGTAITAQFATQPAAYSFTSGLFIVPGIFIRNDTTTPGAIYLRDFKIYQPFEEGYDINNQPNN